MSGRVEVIMGPMFAGKTTELLRRVKRYELGGKACMVVKYARDTRYSADCVASHDNRVRNADVCANTLADIGEAWRAYDVVALDEGQFFPDLLAFCEGAATAGKIVIVAALDGDFRRKPFGDVCMLVPFAEEVTKLTAVCMICRRADGVFTKRIGASTELEVIGGSDMYVAACRKCFDSTPCVVPTPVRTSSAQRETSPA